jgi:hypothetical protein
MIDAIDLFVDSPSKVKVISCKPVVFMQLCVYEIMEGNSYVLLRLLL